MFLLGIFKRGFLLFANSHLKDDRSIYGKIAVIAFESIVCFLSPMADNKR